MVRARYINNIEKLTNYKQISENALVRHQISYLKPHINRFYKFHKLYHCPVYSCRIFLIVSMMDQWGYMFRASA